MSPSKFDLDHFFSEVDAIAVVAPASDLFSLLSRTLKLPRNVTALVTREAGDRALIAPGGELAGDDITEVMFIRTSPLELSFQHTKLTTSDDYLCHVNVTCPVCVVQERSEAESFRKTVLGSRRVVRLSAIAQHLEAAVGHALAALAEAHQVEDLVDGKCRDQAVRALRDALVTPCFQAGLSLVGSITVTFESEGLREVRAKEALTARRMDEHAAQQQLNAALSDARTKHLGELESTLKRLKRLAAESPDAALPDLLHTFKESERAKLYEALFESQALPPATRWLVVASGQELLFFAPESLGAPTRRVPLEGAIGSLRSVQTATDPDGEHLLLAGASRGVYELGADSSAAATTYTTAAPDQVRGGVNSVALAGETLYATHSELGLLRWSRGQPESCTACCTACCADLTGEAKAVRNVHVAGGRVVFSVDDRIVSFASDDENDRRIHTGSTSVITAVLVNEGDVFAGNADGQILHWPEGETTTPRVLHGGSRRPAETIALLTTGGVARLVYTDTTLAVFARVLGDTFTCRYEAGGQTLRRVEVAPDLIVGTNDARDRLLIWRPNQTAQPLASIHVARLTKHSIQDVTLVPLKA